MRKLFLPLAAFLLFTPLASFAQAVAPASGPAPIDAGGYLLNYTPEPGWVVKTSATSGAVVMQLIEKEAGRVSHLAEFRVLKITVPADQRTMPLDEVAKVLCAGDRSYAASVMFPAALSGNLRKRDHSRVGSRELAMYSFVENMSNSVATKFDNMAVVYVWLPDSFKQDGGLYLISGFEYLIAGSRVDRTMIDLELKHMEDVIAAIKPK